MDTGNIKFYDTMIFLFNQKKEEWKLRPVEFEMS